MKLNNQNYENFVNTTIAIQAKGTTLGERFLNILLQLGTNPYLLSFQ
jgi:hypothetical protein